MFAEFMQEIITMVVLNCLERLLKALKGFESCSGDPAGAQEGAGGTRGEVRWSSEVVAGRSAQASDGTLLARRWLLGDFLSYCYA